MDFSEYKVLQALLFFSLPIIWCTWQFITLQRSAGDSDGLVHEEGAGLKRPAPSPEKID